MTISDLDSALDAAVLAGVRALLVMRGYTQGGYDRWQPCENGLQHADELVAHIRKRHGSYFSVGVAGFPESHPESRSTPRGVATDSERAADVQWLKCKVESGADFIICQFTFDVGVWRDFLRRCREAGIRVPILPGIQPLTEYASARLLSRTWAVKLPAAVANQLHERQTAGDADGARECGLTFVAALCDEQLRHGARTGEGCGLHFFVYDSEFEIGLLLARLEAEFGWVRGRGVPPRARRDAQAALQ